MVSAISMRNLQRREQVILGIDPGTTVLGYGVIKTVGNKANLLTMGVVDFKDCETHYDKLNKIFCEFQFSISLDQFNFKLAGQTINAGRLSFFKAKYLLA